MERLAFPLSLQDAERRIERAETTRGTCRTRYDDMNAYVTDMNNIVVSELNHALAQHAQVFYTVLDTAAADAGIAARTRICPHGVAARRIVRKDGANKGRAYFCCPESKCNAFRWDDAPSNARRERYDPAPALGERIGLDALDVRCFEQHGVGVVSPAVVLKSTKPPAEGAADAPARFFLKFEAPRKIPSAPRV